MGAREDDFLSRLRSGLGVVRQAVDPTTPGFTRRGIPGLVRGMVEGMQTDPTGIQTARQGVRMGIEGIEEGNLLKNVLGAATVFTALPLPTPGRGGGTVLARHHSAKVASDPTITHLRREFAGTGQMGEEAGRRKAVNVYIDRPPEPRFEGVPSIEIPLPRSRILEDVDDITKFFDFSRKELMDAQGFAPQRAVADRAEELMEQQGFMGYSVGGNARILEDLEIPGRVPQGTGPAANAARRSPQVQVPQIGLREREQRLRGVFDPEAPPTDATREVGEVFTPPEGYGGTASPLTEAVVRSGTIARMLQDDFIRGQRIMRGQPWYELGGIRQEIGNLDPRYSFEDFNLAGGATSAQSSVPVEISSMAAALYGAKRGLPIDQLKRIYRETVGPGPNKLYLNRGTYSGAQRYMDEGIALPADYTGADWKIPEYTRARMGGGLQEGATAALDTHERKRIWQGVQNNPRLWRLARETLTPTQLAGKAYPLRNAVDYQTLGGLYTAGARANNLRSGAQFQAPRWVGGGQFTGLLTAPDQTFQEIFADVLHATARDRGMDTSPAGLRKLFQRVMEGDEFLLPYFSAKSLRGG